VFVTAQCNTDGSGSGGELIDEQTSDGFADHFKAMVIGSD
jgi:hypothetical protein